MSNSNTNLQTQSSNALHNAIMEAGSKDRPPMLALVLTSTTTRMAKIRNSLQNRGKAIVTSSAPTYDPKPATVTKDEEMSKEKEIDKLMALISLSFKKIYKPPTITFDFIKTTSRRAVNVAGAKENVGTPVVQQSRIQCYNCKNMGMYQGNVRNKMKQADWKDDTDDESEEQELEAHYMYMAQIQEVTPDPVDNSGPIFDDEPMHKDDQDETDNLDQECDLLASLIQKLKLLADHNLRAIIWKIEGYSGSKLAEIFQQEIIRLHGTPASIVLDRDPRFASRFWKGLQNAWGIRLKFSTGFHPQTDGQTEHTIQTLEDMLRSCALEWTGNWDEYLCLVEFAYNNSWHASIKGAPFELLYGQKCRVPICWNEVGERVIEGPELVEVTNEKVAIAKEKLKEARSRQKSYADRHRRALEFKPGDRMVKFGNDQIAPILGYGDLVQGTITIKWVYYVKGLNHNLFSVGQFCDADLEVAFWKSTCYICDLKGNDLLTGSRGTDLYSITLQDFTTPNPICLMAKATSSQAWLWHRRLSHLNFDTINLLSKNNIVNGLPKLKLVKDHLCSSCELGKAKRKSFHTKTTPSSKRRLQLLHMDLCGPMRVESINGKKYVLVIVDDYSRYTWTHFLRSKDETPGVLIDFLTLVQRGLHAQVTTVRTDKGTEFLNKTLHAYFAKEGIRHETSTARTPEQNGVVERRNRTLVEAARTMLSAAKVPLFFWAEAIATACFTQNRSLVIPRHEKTPYHIINARKPSVKFFHIFGSLCYIVRDGENLDKMKEKGDACIFVGYSTQSKAYRVFNKRTRMIVETIHVNFDELPQMASDHVSSDPGPQCSTTVLEQDSLSPGPQSQENVPQVAETVTTSNELELLYSPMFSELLNGNSPVVSKSSAVHAADNPDKRQQHNTTHTSTTTDVADPPPLNIHSTHQTPTQVPTVTAPENITQAETNTENAQFDDDEFINIFSTPVQEQGETSSRHVDSSNMHTFYQHHPSAQRWTKDHPLEQVIGNPSQSVRTRRQLETDGEMCMFALTVSRTEPKNIKEAMADSAWIESMQEELHQFDRLDEDGNLLEQLKQALGRSYALSWKPCQGDSLNLPDHRYSIYTIKRETGGLDDGVAASFQRSRIHKPHAHTQAFKVNHSTSR
ncbi:retrovirus-related pol polyprotein from transposon TNT 1-94 [Tanacetum coccineum]